VKKDRKKIGSSKEIIVHIQRILDRSSLPGIQHVCWDAVQLQSTLFRIHNAGFGVYISGNNFRQERKFYFEMPHVMMDIVDIKPTRRRIGVRSVYPEFDEQQMKLCQHMCDITQTPKVMTMLNVALTAMDVLVSAHFNEYKIDIRDSERDRAVCLHYSPLLSLDEQVKGQRPLSQNLGEALGILKAPERGRGVRAWAARSKDHD
jgi:hypothetical protein